jgi:DNA-binding NtrC family response regulator
LVIPPLRERPGDIRLLLDHFLAKYNKELGAHCPGFSTAALEALMRHPWPGNVRELENVVERSLIFADGEPIDLEVFSQGVHANDAVRFEFSLKAAVHEFERSHIVAVLDHVDGNKAEASHLLGIGLSSLYRKLEELGIDKEDGCTVP